MLKCDVCGASVPLMLKSDLFPDIDEVYCAETCMYEHGYSEEEVEWLFDESLIEWVENGGDSE